MAHVREVARKVSPKYPRGIAYEASWREGHKKLQRTFAVKRDAERFALKVENAKSVGGPTRSLANNSITVAQVVAASMEAARPKLKPRTFHSYELLYANRILPKFGTRRAATITRADVQTWINGLSGEGLAPATVHHHCPPPLCCASQGDEARALGSPDRFQPVRRHRPSEGS